MENRYFSLSGLVFLCIGDAFFFTSTDAISETIFGPENGVRVRGRLFKTQIRRPLCCTQFPASLFFSENQIFRNLGSSNFAGPAVIQLTQQTGGKSHEKRVAMAKARTNDIEKYQY